MNENRPYITELKTGFISSVLLSMLTLTGFIFAMMAVPPSGPYCPDKCMEYPYAGLLDYFPRDYLWMYIISFQLLAFLVFMISNHFITQAEKRIFSFVSVSFAIIAAAVLLADYFIQFSVVPVSMMKGQTEGIPLLTQYNGHGIFIALEELGFILMSLSFLFLSPAVSGKTKPEKTLKIIYAVQFIPVVFSFVYFSLKYGMDRDYRFEVVVITVNWFTAIASGIISAVNFRREIKGIDPA